MVEPIENGPFCDTPEIDLSLITAEDCCLVPELLDNKPLLEEETTLTLDDDSVLLTLEEDFDLFAEEDEDVFTLEDEDVLPSLDKDLLLSAEDDDIFFSLDEDFTLLLLDVSASSASFSGPVELLLSSPQAASSITMDTIATPFDSLMEQFKKDRSESTNCLKNMNTPLTLLQTTI